MLLSFSSAIDQILNAEPHVSANQETLMTKRRRLITLVGISISVFLAAAVPASAQVYSGRAIGVNAAVTVNGTTATTLVADTGPLPLRGGNVSLTVPSSRIPSVGTTGVIASNTSGILQSSQSASIVNHFDFSVSGLRIRAK